MSRQPSRSRGRSAGVGSANWLLLLAGLGAPPAARAQGPAVYRCWSFNAGGAGGSCRTAAPLVFNADGTYQESSTRGRYTIEGDRVTLSASTVRGPGRIAGNNIVFQYARDNLQYTVTYLLQSGSPLAPRGAAGGTAEAGPRAGTSKTEERRPYRR